MFKMHRNLFLVNINPQNATSGVVYKNNVWAQPQAVVQLNAADAEQALELFREAGVKPAEFFEQSERDRVIANAKLYEERALQPPMEKVTGGIIHFPSGYRCRMATDDFVWMADEKQYVQQYVMAYKYPVGGDDVFSLENIIQKRNEVMKANVPHYALAALPGTRLYGNPRLLGSARRLYGRPLCVALLLQPGRKGYHRPGRFRVCATL